MSCRLFVFFLVIFSLLVACSRQSQSSRSLTHQDMVLWAWNEDTVHPYVFEVQKNFHFSYAISNKDGKRGYGKLYKGRFRYTRDTLFLNYTGIKPPGLTTYLVSEGSGKYYIQTFDNSDQRMFLRLQPSYNPHRGF